MFWRSNQIVRIALLLVLFQFLSPAFIPVIGQEIPADRTTSFHVQHSSIVVPLFLKEKEEKEEKEDGEFFFVASSAPLLDLTSHTFNLSISHSNKYSISSQPPGFAPPPLGPLFCTFII